MSSLKASENALVKSAFFCRQISQSDRKVRRQVTESKRQQDMADSKDLQKKQKGFIVKRAAMAADTRWAAP